jgi:hypothetical protein
MSELAWLFHFIMLMIITWVIIDTVMECYERKQKMPTRSPFDFVRLFRGKK